MGIEEEEFDQLSVEDALEAGLYDLATERYYYTLANYAQSDYEKQKGI